MTIGERPPTDCRLKHQEYTNQEEFEINAAASLIINSMSDNSIIFENLNIPEIGSTVSRLIFGTIGLSEEMNNFQIDLEAKYKHLEDNLAYEKARVYKEIDILNELSRQKMLQYNQETINNLEDRIKRDEFKWFCDNIWNARFEVGPDTILTHIKETLLLRENIICPALIIGWTSGFSSAYFKCPSAQDNYLDFCEEIFEEYTLSRLFDLSFVSMFRKQSTSSISDSLIAHYLMQGLPTLVLYPEIIDNLFRLDIVYWTHLRGHASISQLTGYKCCLKSPSPNYNLEVHQMIKDSVVLFSSLIADIFHYSLNYKKPSYTIDALSHINNPDLVDCVQKALNNFSLI